MEVKYIAYALIVIGAAFTGFSIYLAIVSTGWLEFVPVWFVFGPLPLLIGVLWLKYIQKKINPKALKKLNEMIDKSSDRPRRRRR